jgi:hypothetical protein
MAECEWITRTGAGGFAFVRDADRPEIALHFMVHALAIDAADARVAGRP